MSFAVISNPAYQARPGFTQAQFKKLDDLYCRAASLKALNYRTVDCDFEEGVAIYTYYINAHHTPLLQFVIRRIGPADMMYEVFCAGKGRIAKSGVFERAFACLKSEIAALF